MLMTLMQLHKIIFYLLTINCPRKLQNLIILPISVVKIKTNTPSKLNSYSLAPTCKTVDNIIHFPILRRLIQRCTKYKKMYAPKIISFRSRKLRLLERLNNNEYYNSNKGYYRCFIEPSEPNMTMRVFIILESLYNNATPNVIKH